MDNFWPACTVTGCGHRRTYPDGHALFEAIREHSDVWLGGTGGGDAVCVCHSEPVPVDGPRERFACDVARDRRPEVTR